jgi:flagellar biosynthesis/type III secretory pathway chaperone
MEELISLVEKLRISLQNEMVLLKELLPVLDKEESMLTEFMVPELESVILEKDQIVKQVKFLEKKRLQNLQRICFLTGFDCRGALPSLSELNKIFETYENTVESLLEKSVFAKLRSETNLFKQISFDYIDFFARTAPRIQRNQKIMAKLAAGMAKSTKILLERSGFTQSYDAQGKTFTQVPSKLPLSSLKVKA